MSISLVRLLPNWKRTDRIRSQYGKTNGDTLLGQERRFFSWTRGLPPPTGDVESGAIPQAISKYRPGTRKWFCNVSNIIAIRKCASHPVLRKAVLVRRGNSFELCCFEVRPSAAWISSDSLNLISTSGYLRKDFHVPPNMSWWFWKVSQAYA